MSMAISVNSNKMKEKHNLVFMQLFFQSFILLRRVEQILKHITVSAEKLDIISPVIENLKQVFEQNQQELVNKHVV